MAEAFDSVRGMPVLSSDVVKALVERVDLYVQGRVEIRFRFRDELDTLLKEILERRGDTL